MIIVTSLDCAHEAFARYRPAMVISILDAEAIAPEFPGLARTRHTRLCVEKTRNAAELRAAANARAEKLIDLINTWDRRGDILIHCHLGVSRSTAAAFVIQCLLSPDRSEEEIAKALRAAAPHADPCLQLISQADDLLGREGRMIEAIEDLCPACATDTAPIVTLPLAA